MEKIILKNVKLRWAYLGKVQDTGEFASNKYQVDVVFGKSDYDAVNKLKNKKQIIKDLGNGEYSITLKSAKKPTVLDSHGIRMDDAAANSIGNDSIAHVSAAQYVGFGKQLFLGLSAVKVINLVPYGDTSHDFDGIDDSDSEEAPFSTDDELI